MHYSVREYLERKLGLTADVIEAKFAPVADDELAALNARARRDDRAHPFIEFHGGRWIELTDIQEETKLKQLPLVVFGPGGSGKSTIALSMLLQSALEEREEALPVLYLSESPRLVSEMQRQFLAAGPKVKFLTINKLLTSVLGITEDQLLPENDFVKWYQSGARPEPIVDLDTLWEEIKICAACQDVGEYKALGERQSLVSREKRASIYAIYKEYSEKNTKANRVSSALLRSEAVHPQYSLILLDEAQNVPPALLQVLARLAENNNMVYFSGEQQSIRNRISNVSAIKSYYFKQGIALSECHLTTTHRCPQQVASLVSELMHLKRQVVGGLTEKGEQTEMHAVVSAAKGQISWLEPGEIEANMGLIQAQRADFAVVTLAAHVAEIKRIFPKAVVFTVAEAQGLGIKNLLVYKVFQPLCEVLATGIGNADHVHRGKVMDLSHSQDLDTLITAITRAEENLTIVEESSTRHEKQMKAHLAQFCLKAAPGAAAAQVESTSEEWEQKAHELLRSGHHAQARHIWCVILKRTEESFPGHQPKTAIAVTKKPLAVEEVAYTKDDKAFLETWIQGASTKKIREHFNEGLLEYKNLSVVLMDVPVKDDDCLLSYILKDERLGDIFCNADIGRILKFKQASTSQLIIDYLCERHPASLVKMTENKSFCENFTIDLITPERVVSWLFKVYLNVLEKILISSGKNMSKFCKADMLYKAIDGVTIFALLTEYEEGIKFLSNIFKKTPKLVSGLSVELLSICHERADSNANKSPLYFLSVSPDGVVLLSQLFKTAPGLMQGISADALCLPLTAAAGQFANTSPLFWLSGKPDGRALLGQLFTANPALMEGISAQALCLELTEAAGADANTSPLYWLACCTDGRALLGQLFTVNPGLMKDISAKALCLTRTAAAGADANTSPLYFLSVRPYGRALLTQLFTANPGLMQGISAQALCLALTEAAGLYANTSPLYFLSSAPDGHEILDKLLKKNHLLHGVMNESFLKAKIDDPITKTQVSIWANLSTSEIGLSIRTNLLRPSTLEEGFFSGSERDYTSHVVSQRPR